MGRERAQEPEKDEQDVAAAPAAAAAPVGLDLHSLARAGVGARARALTALQAGGGNAQVSRAIAAAGPLIQRAPLAPEEGPTFEESMTTLLAIIAIIGRWHYVEDGMAVRRTHPQDHPDVPQRHRDLLEEWFHITYGTVEHPDGTKTTYRGPDLATHIDMAMAHTKPLLDVIRTQGDARAEPFIAKNFESEVAKFRARAVTEEVTDTIDEHARLLGAGTAFQEMTEDEVLKATSLKTLETVRLATTLVTRYTNGAAVDAAKKLDAAFKQAVENVNGPPGIEAVKKAANAQLALMQLKGMLDGVNAIVAVADPERRARLISERDDLFGTVASTANVIQVLAQFVSGAAALTSAATYAYAIVTGNARLAAQVATKAAPVLDRINIVLNFIGVVHGTLVLLDEEATAAQKEAAVLEVGVSGAGVAGFVARLAGVGGVGGPLTAAVVISFFSFRAILQKGAEMITNMIKLGLTICFRDMATTGRQLSDTAIRFAVALDLAAKETDPVKKAEYLDQIHGLRWNLKNFYLKAYIERATRAKGNDNQDPGAYPALRKRFAPLKELPLETDENLIDAAGLLLRTMSEVMARPEEILEEAVIDAIQRRASVDLPLPPEDPTAPPGDDASTLPA